MDRGQIPVVSKVVDIRENQMPGQGVSAGVQHVQSLAGKRIKDRKFNATFRSIHGRRLLMAGLFGETF